MPELEAVHDRLRGLLEPYRAELSVTADGPGGLTLEVPGLEGKPWGYVAGTRVGKRYVSFYLMPVYAVPSGADHLSPALLKRKQGKACFNFTAIDEECFAELGRLVSEGRKIFSSEKFRQSIEKMQ